MQDYIIKVCNKQYESLISEIYVKQKMAKMISAFKNVQEINFD